MVWKENFATSRFHCHRSNLTVFFLTSDWKSGPSSFEKNVIAPLGMRILPTKTPFCTLPTPPAERARASSLAFQGRNTRKKGVSKDLNEKCQGHAQKVTSWHSCLNLCPGLWRYATFGPRDETSHTKRYLHTLHLVTAHSTQSIREKSVWKSPLCGQSNRLRW